MKKMVPVSVTDLRYEIEDDLEKVIEKLQALIVPGVKRWIDISLDYDDCIEVTLMEERLETDREETFREDTEKKRAEQQRQWDLQQLANLKRKYE
jgi:flavodoxin